MKDLSNDDLDRMILEREQTGLTVRCAADIPPEAIEFIWPARIARGKHSTIAGDPGTGKSQLSINIAATVTRGREWPCGEGFAPIGSVIFLSAEDGAADTIVPRLIAADAELSRVFIVSAVREENGVRRSFNLQADLALLEQKIREIGDVALVIIDPVSSYLGKTDSHKNAEVRSVLEPVSEMAERTRVAILSVTHFSKGSQGGNTKALHRFIGSIAFTGAPRAAFAVVTDPEDEGRRLFLHGKNNMAAAPQGLSYRVTQSLLPGHSVVASRIVWEPEPVRISADEAMAESNTGNTASARDEAREFLQELLSDGPVPTNKIKLEAGNAGLSWATIRRAKDSMGLKKMRQSDGKDGSGRWLWYLPDETAESATCSPTTQDAQPFNVSTLQECEHLADAVAERAAVLEFDHGLPRAEAEAQARREAKA